MYKKSNGINVIPPKYENIGIEIPIHPITELMKLNIAKINGKTFNNHNSILYRSLLI